MLQATVEGVQGHESWCQLQDLQTLQPGQAGCKTVPACCHCQSANFHLNADIITMRGCPALQCITHGPSANLDMDKLRLYMLLLVVNPSSSLVKEVNPLNSARLQKPASAS